MSKKLKLSPWHDGSVKPVHVGVYELYCNCCRTTWFSWWDGKNFCEVEKSIFSASKHTKKDKYLRLKEWRGVLK